MIFFDVTKTATSGHRSGLTRVTARLGEELGASATPVRWATWDRAMRADDWFFTAELFSEAERPGITEFLQRSAGRKAAIFHDAIPLKLPHLTWPQSVARHPGYMKLLATFDHLWAVSAASRDELRGFWQWQGLARVPGVDVIALGADFNGAGRATADGAGADALHRATPVSLLGVGILEPRKNQALLLDVAAALWGEGVGFELHLVGRVNPHFGGPTVKRIKALRKKYPGLHYHEAADDAAVAALYAGARASLFPTLAEGCGLPLIESLWRGVPCVHSDLPVLRENAAGGGCLAVAIDDRAAWKKALREIVTNDALQARLASEARSRPLPTWAQAAQALRAVLA